MVSQTTWKLQDVCFLLNWNWKLISSPHFSAMKFIYEHKKSIFHKVPDYNSNWLKELGIFFSWYYVYKLDYRNVQILNLNSACYIFSRVGNPQVQWLNIDIYLACTAKALVFSSLYTIFTHIKNIYNLFIYQGSLIPFMIV